MATETLFALEGRPTAQLIADQLRETIIRGGFQPGQQINESILAAQLQTSRAPIREALQRLCQEGILISRRNHGVFVLQLSIEEIKEIYAVRQTVESAVVDCLLDGNQKSLAATCETLKGLVKEMGEQIATSDWQAIARLDMQFHTEFVAGTGNSRMLRIYQTLAAESRICMLGLEVSYPQPEALAQEHQHLLDLLLEGDRKGLKNAIRHHLQKAVEDLRPDGSGEKFTV